MGEQPKLEVQLVLACVLSIPASMRSSRVVAMLTEAMRNPDFARELQKNPREVFERRCGIVIPAETTLEVHLSSADSVHLVLPPASVSTKRADGRVEISDEDLLSEGLSNARDLRHVAKTPPLEAYVKAGK